MARLERTQGRVVGEFRKVMGVYAANKGWKDLFISFPGFSYTILFCYYKLFYFIVITIQNTQKEILLKYFSREGLVKTFSARSVSNKEIKNIQ